MMSLVLVLKSPLIVSKLEPLLRRMTSLQSSVLLCLCVLQIFESHQTFVDLPPNKSIQSLTEKETILPCVFKPGQGTSVVQITWLKKTASQPENIITAHNTDGQTVFPKWAQRVRFKSRDPIQNSSLVLMNTDISDEGIYICRISSFPDGNFETEISLKLWIIPITSLEPVILVEGEPLKQVASCRSSGHPVPRLSWDTDQPGQSSNRNFSGGVVSTQYFLHPLKSMNGKKLDCLVWHPAFLTPQRIKNNLVVQFAPQAEVKGYNNSWFIGMKNIALNCVSGGNPKPQNFTWTRIGGELPRGARAHPDGRLEFVEPLTSEDKGTYQCVAANTVGEAAAQVDISLKDPPLLDERLMILIVAVVCGLLILMVIIVISVICYHKRKNKKLKEELNKKTDEVDTLSRQASVRRVHSASTDARGLEQACCRDSRSTISAFDSLGRPAIHRSTERYQHRDENMYRVEEFVRSSVSSQKAHYYQPLVANNYSVGNSHDGFRHLNGSAIIAADGGSRQGSVLKNHQVPPMSYGYSSVMDDEDVDEGLGGPASQEHPDDQDSVTNSFHVSEPHCS
ncbi:nectin-4 isoform X2 [Oryzias melastigma]|uniref:nectin-4 isoform X2 n=1 Tax=Oryzias melastigma TaxID=30732 RepID=UPI000CF8063F|nr:nectin-4 isoform X2 [Oryzias melastigma]